MSNFLTFLESKKYYVILIAIILFFFLLRTILLRSPNTELTYTVKQENLVDSVQVSGTYTTASQIDVTSPTNGVIDKLFVTNNDTVKKGDPLFHIQSTATVDQQKTAYANYLAANSAVQADKATLYNLQSAMYTAWNNYVNLATSSTYQNSDGSPQTSNRVLPAFTTLQDNWLATEAQYKNQQDVIAKDQAALSSTQQLYAETQSVTVISPISGNVVNLLAKIGDQVSTPQLPSTSAPVLMIANLGNPYITAEISEDYAVRISQGQKVAIVFDALKDKSFSGMIENIDTVGTNTQGVITYPARITADNIPSVIKPKMTALITIETLRKDNVIDVPNSAIFTKQDTAYVEQANTHKQIPVMLGIKGVAKTEITNGLSSGTSIVANPSTN